MITYEKTYRIAPEITDKDWILQKAEQALAAPNPHITDEAAPRSEGGPHDYYSNADYWWPDPAKPDGLPFIQRDGETNPENFNAHRVLLRGMRTQLAALAAAFRLTGEERYAAKAAGLVKEFFLDEKTKMNPHLTYAQAIPGVCPGRGIGIIDTLHLIDVPFAMEALKSSQSMTEEIYAGVKQWFAQYLGWMLSHKNGIDEMNTTNNHAVCFFVQAAAFALFTDNPLIVDFCRAQYKRLLNNQMAPDGGFPRELGRTKPYNYSIFVVDNMTTLCQLLSCPEDNLWEYATPDGRSIRKGIEFLLPYLLNKSSWPYPKDVMHFDAFPARASFMQFAGCALGIPQLLELYQSLPLESQDEEARRNIAVRQPMLWF